MHIQALPEVILVITTIVDVMVHITLIVVVMLGVVAAEQEVVALLEMFVVLLILQEAQALVRQAYLRELQEQLLVVEEE